MMNMIQNILSKFSLALIDCATATQLEALDWTQFRGPDRTDVSKEIGLLKQWQAGGPPRRWLYQNAGPGYSGFSTSRGKVLTMITRDDMEQILALDEQTGQELWVASLSASFFTEDHGDGPRGTPTIDGDHIYALGSRGTLICVNFADG